MHDVAAFLGYLAGTMLDPLIWGIVAVIVFTMRRQPIWLTGAASLVCVAFAAGAIALSIDDPVSSRPGGEARRFFFTMIATLIWFAVLFGVSRLWKAR